MKRIIQGAVAIALVAGAVWFLCAPLIAFLNLRAAAEDQDAARLQRLVDFQAVRRSLAPRMDQAPSAWIAARPDRFLTPDGLSGLTRGEGWAAAYPPMGPGSTDPYEWHRPYPRPVRPGLGRFEMSVSSLSGDRTLFIFERQGVLRWMLVDVRLPVDPRPS